MFSHQTQIRICYADTDQMGFVYYGNYAKFFEIGRVEAIRFLGVTYKDIEEDNKIMPVAALHIKYLQAAKYDDLICIETRLTEFPQHHKIHFEHKVWNEQKHLLAKGSVDLYVLEKNSMRTSTLPPQLLRALAPYFHAPIPLLV